MANIVRASSLDRDPRTKDFRNMLYSTWMELGLGKPTPLQYDMAHLLQSASPALEGEGVREILMGFRGVAKSYITTTFAVWRLKRDRSERVMVNSATAAFAGNISTFAYRMVTTFDWLADMKPRSDQRQSALAFDVAGAPVAKDESFAALSIFGQITGRRASLIVGDDLETPNTSDTEGNRLALEGRMGEYGAIILPGGDIWLLGTAQTERTIYKKYGDEKGFHITIYPILYPTHNDDPKKDEFLKYGTRLAPFIDNAVKANPELQGTSTEPSRFSEADIAQRRRLWGNVEFDRQFKMFMDAGAGEKSPLHMRDLVVLDIPPPNPAFKKCHVLLPSDISFTPIPAAKLDIEVDALNGDSAVFAPQRADAWVEAEETICHIDTSGEGEDETSWTIGAELYGRVAVLCQGHSIEGHTPATMKAIALDCLKWRVQKIFPESNFGGSMFGELLLPAVTQVYHPGGTQLEQDTIPLPEICSVPAERIQKERRIIETLQPMTSDHRLIVNASVLRCDFPVPDYESVEMAKLRYYRLTYQLSRMTRQKGAVPHDDRADSLASMVAHFIGILLRRQDKAASDGKSRLMDEEVEKVIEARRLAGLPVIGEHLPHDAGFGRGQHRRR